MLSLIPVLLFYYSQIAIGNTSSTTIRDYIITEALVMGVDPQIAQGIVERESRFDCASVGDFGTSKGCWQIHLPAHKEITSKQAHDVIWSTQWSLNEIKKNGCQIWSTCRDVMESVSASH